MRVRFPPSALYSQQVMALKEQLRQTWFHEADPILTLRDEARLLRSR